MKDKILFPLRLLRSFCPPQWLEEIEGDLLQNFERDVKTHGEWKAKKKLLSNTLSVFKARDFAKK